MRIIGDLVLAGFGQLKNARIENVSSDPAAPQNGQVWFNTTDTVYRGFDGTDVITFATGGNTQLIIDALAAETTNRTNADNTLQNNINAEATARSDADTILTNNLAAEVTNRQNADNTLTNNLNAEATARANADNTLTNNLAAEVTNRQNADNTLQNNINAEATARSDADIAEASARDAAIAVEATARSNAIIAEASSRTAADNTEATARADADTAETSARIAADALKVAKAGDSMTGNLAMQGNEVIGLPAIPSTGDAAASKNYVDSTVSGLSWKQAVDAAGASLPGTAVAGLRFLNFTDGKIYTATVTDTFNAGVAAAGGDAVFVKTDEQGWTYDGSVWTQFTGTGMISAGIGLAKTGNQMDVNLGAGIAQLPSDEVGVDLRATGGLLLTIDGTTPSTDTDAQLAIRLSDSSLTLGGSGIQVSSAIQSALSTATADILTEATARADADTAETSARIAAISAEATTRANADNTLQGNINAEATARSDADTTLTNNLNTEVTARSDADTTLTNNLNTEVTNRTNADNTLQNNINAEATTRANAIAAEATARADADTADSNRLTNSHFVYNGSTSASTHSVNHNLGQKYTQVIVVDSADKVIIPDAITFVDANNLTVDFISSITCKVAVTAPKSL